MIIHHCIKDIRTKKINIFTSQTDANSYVENHAYPNDLIDLTPVYVDGSGYNGRFSRIAYGLSYNIKIDVLNSDLTNNEAEYKAVIQLLETMSDNHTPKIILSDSRLIVEQIKGTYKCRKDHLRVLRNIARGLLRNRDIDIAWVPREENWAGIELENTK